MLPVDFEGSNTNLTKPVGWKDEDCSSMPALFVQTDLGGCYLTAWMPNKEDLEALNAGRPLFLKQIGTRFQPVDLLTLDENDNPNQ